nr:hypothetical protein [uncultured Roseateles sp.]
MIPPAPAQPVRRSAVEILLGGVIGAPLLENLLVVAALAVLGNWLSKRDAALAVTAVAVLLHAVFATWSGIAALVLFAVLTFSYEAWRAQGTRLAFLVIFLQHALFNLPATAEAAYHALG